MPHSSVESSPAREAPGEAQASRPQATQHFSPRRLWRLRKSLSLPRLLGGMFLKFPCTQHKQETAAKALAVQIPCFQLRAGDSRLVGEGKQQTF